MLQNFRTCISGKTGYTGISGFLKSIPKPGLLNKSDINLKLIQLLESVFFQPFFLSHKYVIENMRINFDLICCSVKYTKSSSIIILKQYAFSKYFSVHSYHDRIETFMYIKLTNLLHLNF